MSILHKNVTSWSGPSFLWLNAFGSRSPGTSLPGGRAHGMYTAQRSWAAPTSPSPFSDTVIEIPKWMKISIGLKWQVWECLWRVCEYTRKCINKTSVSTVDTALAVAWTSTGLHQELPSFYHSDLAEDKKKNSGTAWCRAKTVPLLTQWAPRSPGARVHLLTKRTILKLHNFLHGMKQQILSLFPLSFHSSFSFFIT